LLFGFGLPGWALSIRTTGIGIRYFAFFKILVEFAFLVGYLKNLFLPYDALLHQAKSLSSMEVQRSEVKIVLWLVLYLVLGGPVVPLAVVYLIASEIENAVLFSKHHDYYCSDSYREGPVKGLLFRMSIMILIKSIFISVVS